MVITLLQQKNEVINLRLNFHRILRLIRRIIQQPAKRIHRIGRVSLGSWKKDRREVKALRMLPANPPRGGEGC
jgi:hypothetical protein